MKYAGAYVEELLEEVNDMYPSHPLVDRIWEQFELRGHLSALDIRELEQLRSQGQRAADLYSQSPARTA